MANVLWLTLAAVATAVFAFATLAAPAILGPIVLLVALVAAIILARKRLGVRNLAAVPDPPGYAWELVLLPLAVSVRQHIIITLGLIAICFLIAVVRRGGENSRAAILPVALLALAAAVSVRTSVGLLALLVAVLAVIFVSRTKTSVQLAVKSLTAGLAVYLIANTVGQIAGIASPASAVRIGGFASSGVFGERFLFPFARSINEPTIVFAAFIVMVAARWMLKNRPTALHVFGVVAGIYIVLGSNSRVPAVLAVILTLAVLAVPATSSKVLPVAVPVAMAAPFFLAALQPALMWVAGLVVNIPYLARGQNVIQIVELGTRGPIWQGALTFWWTEAGTTGKLLGYGPNGHATSGANLYYLAGQDKFLNDSTALTTHNSFLQTLLDGGLLSLGLLAVALTVTLFRFARTSETLPQLLAVSAIGLCGVMEVVVAPAATTTPSYLLLILAAFVPTAKRAERQPQTADSSAEYSLQSPTARACSATRTRV